MGKEPSQEDRYTKAAAQTFEFLVSIARSISLIPMYSNAEQSAKHKNWSGKVFARALLDGRDEQHNTGRWPQPRFCQRPRTYSIANSLIAKWEKADRPTRLSSLKPNSVKMPISRRPFRSVRQRSTKRGGCIHSVPPHDKLPPSSGN